ncbi:MAG: hypothetical protein HXS47_12560 [Theionarchaea archaeon]|nr:hypothetical protein [Theionarchaea archaeon]
MNRIFTLMLFLLFITGCLSQVPPTIETCTPAESALSIYQGEVIEFSCTASDPDTEELHYIWYVNGESVSDTYWYDFDRGEGTYSVLMEVTDGTSTLSQKWQVEVINIPNFEKIQIRLEDIRGLLFINPVQKVEINRDELREQLKESLSEDFEDIAMEKQLFVAMHVMDPSIDLYQIYVDMLTTQIASYYDTSDHIFYEVVDQGAPVIYREFIAAHEFIHALQDQHGLLEGDFDNDDTHLAFLCVVEGDAMFHQYKYLDTMTFKEKKVLFDYVNNLDIPQVNPFLENLMMLRYSLGLEFIAFMSMHDIDSIYDRPPVSSEQVIHPEKYIMKEKPIVVYIPSLPGWNSRDENVLGEAFLQTMLTEHIDGDIAEQAAEGWGGDAYGYYTQGETYLYILNTVWDTERDATEFYDAYLQFSTAWSNHGLETIGTSLYTTPTGYLALLQRGKEVLIIESPSLEAVTDLLLLMTSS